LLLTVKNNAITSAAAETATTGSNRLAKKGSEGISPLVKGYEVFQVPQFHRS